MLTKSEREEIAERAKKCMRKDWLDSSGIYAAFFGRPTIDSMLLVGDDYRKTFTRIIDLCDTSNMIELPLDKDGEVIHAGDTVYVGDREFTVNGFIFNDNGVTVRVVHTKLSAPNFYKSNELTHKKTVTVASLVEQFKHVLEKGEMSYWAVGEICDIVDQLEMLGDSDD